MSEKKEIPKPTIRSAPPVKPPVTAVNMEKTVGKTEEPKPPEVQEEVSSADADGVETDLVKRFLGVFIDGIAAGLIGFIIVGITGSGFLQWIAIGLVFLTRDSLPVLEGQSLGKKMMKTKAVKEDGSSLSGDWVTGATRNILFAVPVVGIVECFILLTRSGNPGAGLRLGDNWAKTKVISVD